jgi:chromosome segregation ATPase
VEKTLRLLEQKLEDLYSEKIKLEKSIVDSKNNISQSQDEIAILKNDIITLNDQLTAEKTALSLLKNEEAIKQKESVIKTIEKNKKRNMDLVNSDEKKIVDSNSAIESANLNITTNLGEQENLRYQINVQKEIVNTADLKYRNIINSNLNN